MGACVSSHSCRGRMNRSCSIDQLPTDTIQTDHNSNNNNVSISSINASNSNNNNIANLHQIQTNSEQGSLSNLASIINNSISFNSSNSNSVLIANTLTNTTTSYYNNNNNSFSNFVPPTGKNKKLKKDYIKFFKFDKKITESQLNAKREEFWDTAPAFEGKIEIWTALKAAVEAYEQKNYQLAQAIIDSANIILPRGFLNDCYDELGNRYQIPIYVLAKPINMRKSTGSDEKDSVGVDDDSVSTSNLKKAFKKSKKKENNDLDLDEDEDDDEEDNDVFNIDDMNVQKSKSNFFRNKLRFSKCKNTNSIIGSSSFSNIDNKKSKKIDEAQLKRSNSNDETFQIKIRLSNAYNENDMKVTVTSVQTVAQLKSQISEMTSIEVVQQRLFFGGKLMKDKQKLRDHKLRRNVVVQVIVREAKVPKVINNEELQAEAS